MSVEVSPIPPATPTRPLPHSAPKRPRLWPAVALVALYWAAVVTSYALELGTFPRFVSRLGAAVLLILVFAGCWWASRRVRLRDRAAGFALVVAGAAAVQFLGDPSATGFGLVMLVVPCALTAATLWAVAGRRLSAGPWRAGLTAAVALTCGAFLLIRFDGIDGEQYPEFHWRWSPTAEELFKAERAARVRPG